MVFGRNTVIFAGELIPATTILGLLNGTEQYVIANKYFPKESLYSPKYDDITVKSSEGPNGFRLRGPTIYIKSPKGEFVRNYVIAWTMDKNSQKRYYILKPSEQSLNPMKQQMNLLVKPNMFADPPKEDDLNMAAFEYQILMATQVLIVANMFGVDLSKYKTETTNDAFFTRFANELNTILKEKCTENEKKLQLVEFDKGMIDSFVKIPVYGVIDKNCVPVLEETQADEELVQAFTSFWDAIKKSFKKYLEKPNKYLPDLEIPATLTKLLSENNFQPLPTFRSQKIITKDDKSITSFDAKLRITSAAEPGSDGAREFKYTTKQKVSADSVKPLTMSNMIRLWGGTTKEPNPKDKRGEAHEGKIYVIPRLDLKYYKQGNPTMSWITDKLCIRVIKQQEEDYDGGEEYYDESSDDKLHDKQGASIPEPTSDEDGYNSPY